jgi:hypothetical protein
VRWIAPDEPSVRKPKAFPPDVTDRHMFLVIGQIETVQGNGLAALDLGHPQHVPLPDDETPARPRLQRQLNRWPGTRAVLHFDFNC